MIPKAPFLEKKIENENVRGKRKSDTNAVYKRGIFVLKIKTQYTVWENNRQLN